MIQQYITAYRISASVFIFRVLVSVPCVCGVQVGGSASLQWDSLRLQTQLKYGKDSYALSSTSRYRPGPVGRWNLEMSYPSRNVTFFAIGSVQGNRADLDLDLAWDKGRDDSAKVRVTRSHALSLFRYKQTKTNKNCPEPIGNAINSIRHNYILHRMFRV